jgi:hypothetical protein
MCLSCSASAWVGDYKESRNARLPASGIRDRQERGEQFVVKLAKTIPAHEYRQRAHVETFRTGWKVADDDSYIVDKRETEIDSDDFPMMLE